MQARAGFQTARIFLASFANSSLVANDEIFTTVFRSHLNVDCDNSDALRSFFMKFGVIALTANAEMVEH